MTEVNRVLRVRNDTIAAISTPPARGGIGIIRMSGERCREITEKIFKGSIEKSHTIRYGFIFDPKTCKAVDEVLVTYMKGPKTYTTEDVVEINCHSGIAVLNKIMGILIENGARQAERGEFTKRAFLNGRIDLSQAEAVIDIINAKTDMGRQSAASQLSGRLFGEIKSFMDGILLCLANIEASIDYPEHSDDFEQRQFLSENIGSLLERARKLYNSAELGRIIKEGINTVIIGETNVGKSSLLNYFAGCDRAIVTDIHGTTRDILEESINLNGVLLKLSDTAGIRETDDIVEKIGVERALIAAGEADLVLYVFDSSKEQDTFFLKPEDKPSARMLAIVNKCDLPDKANHNNITKTFGAENVLKVSIKERTGMDALERRIKQLFFDGELEYGDEAIISNIRQKNALYNAVNSLESCIKSIDDGFPEDIVSIDLMEAYRSLGEITGDSLDEELADKIFSEFCLGK